MLGIPGKLGLFVRAFPSRDDVSMNVIFVAQILIDLQPVARNRKAPQSSRLHIPRRIKLTELFGSPFGVENATGRIILKNRIPPLFVITEHSGVAVVLKTGFFRHSNKSGARLTQNRTCQERKIKVNQIHYLCKLKDDPAGAGLPVPWIQLKGYWLQRAGFEIDTPVKVRVMDGCLVLTTTNEPAGS
jgi:hypothetical protein